LGEASKIDQLEIRWPNGQTESVSGLETNQFVTIQEGKGIVKTAKPSQG
jgi:hypothetical protein